MSFIRFPALCLLLTIVSTNGQEFLKNAGEKLLALRECASHTSCNACATDPLCHWCGAKMTMEYKRETTSSVPFGSCQLKTTTCSSVRFGNLNRALNFHYWGIARVQFNVVEVPSTSDQCSTASSPPEITAKNCEECNDLGSDYAWCLMEAKAGGFIKVTSPAVCLRKDLQFLCNKTVVPKKLPGLAGYLKFYMYLQKSNMCGSWKTMDLPDAQDDCSKNLSCKTCGSSGRCTWCGGMAKAVIPQLDKTTPIVGNLFGVCIDGEDASCKNVKMGTLADYMNKVPGYRTSYKVEAIDEDSQYCTTVNWPSVGALQCDECANRTDAGWCHITAANVRVPKTSSTMNIDGGFCATNGLSFACSFNNEKKQVKSDWYSDSCPPKKTN